MTEYGPRAEPSRSESRREAMLRSLIDEMRRLHRRRRGARRAASAAALGLVVWWGFPRTDPSSVANREDRAPMQRVETRIVRIARAERNDEARFASYIVPTDPSVLSRFREEPRSQVVRLGDDELIKTLAAIGRPAGLIYIGDGVRLSANVVDLDNSAAPPLQRG